MFGRDGVVKSVLTLLVVAFIVYYIVQDPVGAAEIVRGIIAGIVAVLSALADGFSTFLRSLT